MKGEEIELKIVKVSDHIWILKMSYFIPIQVWVVMDKEGLTLVDAGIAMMGKNILKFIKELKCGPLQRIVLTHGHPDHVGSVHSIVSETNVPVYAHKFEIPFIEGVRPYPRRKKAKKLVPSQIVQPLREDEQGNLHKVAGLQPYLTPGHSPGHVVYYHEQDKVLLAGDLFITIKGRLRPPLAVFTANMKEAVQSSKIVETLKPIRLEVCHGGSVFNPADQLDDYLQRWKKT